MRGVHFSGMSDFPTQLHLFHTFSSVTVLTGKAFGAWHIFDTDFQTYDGFSPDVCKQSLMYLQLNVLAGLTDFPVCGASFYPSVFCSHLFHDEFHSGAGQDGENQIALSPLIFFENT